MKETAPYSITEPNVMKKQQTKYTSMPLMYEILGKEALVLQMNVTIVKTVVMPRETRAGAAVRSNQNETHDRMTSSVEGM